MRKLTLSTETLRVLDDEDLTQVVGGVFTGNSGSCNKSGTGTGSERGSGQKKGCQNGKNGKNSKNGVIG